jgi:hypothetical protein
VATIDDELEGQLSRPAARLVLVVGQGKTRALRRVAQKDDAVLLNLSLELARLLLELPTEQRPTEVRFLVKELVEQTGTGPLLVDNLELLFEASLRTDPLGLLKSLARHRLIIAAWPGHFLTERLKYAEPGHREHREYRRADLSGVEIIESTD